RPVSASERKLPQRQPRRRRLVPAAFEAEFEDSDDNDDRGRRSGPSACRTFGKGRFHHRRALADDEDVLSAHPIPRKERGIPQGQRAKFLAHPGASGLVFAAMGSMTTPYPHPYPHPYPYPLT